MAGVVVVFDGCSVWCCRLVVGLVLVLVLMLLWTGAWRCGRHVVDGVRLCG